VVVVVIVEVEVVVVVVVVVVAVVAIILVQRYRLLWNFQIHFLLGLSFGHFRLLLLLFSMVCCGFVI